MLINAYCIQHLVSTSEIHEDFYIQNWKLVLCFTVRMPFLFDIKSNWQNSDLYLSVLDGEADICLKGAYISLDIKPDDVKCFFSLIKPNVRTVFKTNYTATLFTVHASLQ